MAGAMLAGLPMEAHAGLYPVTGLGTLGGSRSVAFGINASGQVTRCRAFHLDPVEGPVPEPTTLLLVGSDLAGLAVTAWSRGRQR